MFFKNSPFEILEQAFNELYPDKKYTAYLSPGLQDEDGEEVFGYTDFGTEEPIVMVDAGLGAMQATEIGAHELAHVAAGKEAGHGEEWEKAFDAIYDRYNELLEKKEAQDGKRDNL